MLYIRIVLMTVCVIYLIIFICYLILSKKAIMLFALNSVSGLLFLSLLKLSENYLPVEININVVSVALSIFGGVPGLGQYLLIDFLFL